MKTENNETQTTNVAELVYAIALNSGIAENAKELTILAINALRASGFKSVQAGLKGTQKELPALKDGELSHTICVEMASAAFTKNNLIYNTQKQLSEAITKFKTSLAFALESGLWEANVSRYKADMLKLQGVMGKVVIDAAIANGTIKVVKEKSKNETAAATPKPFDVAKVADGLCGKYTTKQINALIIELQKQITA